MDGFGYDPLFLVAPDFTQTSAEITPQEKNKLSHRGHAARLMAAQIAQLRAT
jgi:XTP/dITP diphosphohydrolase